MRLLAAMLLASACSSSTTAPTTREQLGQRLFTDPALSRPAGQACADCHAASAAFRDPESDHSTSAGAEPGRFGPRNSPTAMYARYTPPLQLVGGRPHGGLFWDGRADSLEQQAAAPLLNPLEMNNPDQAAVVATVRATYAQDFADAFGAGSLDDVDQGFAHVTEAIAAYERTAALAPFSSRYDRYLAGAATLTASELRGLAIFEDPQRGNCAGCHPSRPSSDGTPPLFTSFGYANLGIPRYANSMFFLQPPPLDPDGDRYVDHGLMATTHDEAHDGMFRVPTLRNVARTGPFGHNGYFQNLPYMLDFLASRDTGSSLTGPWSAPEVAANLDPSVGHLALTPQDLDDLAAFLGALTDDGL